MNASHDCHAYWPEACPPGTHPLDAPVTVTPVQLTCAECENSFAFQPMDQAFIVQRANGTPLLMCQRCGAREHYKNVAIEAQRQRRDNSFI